MRHSRSDIMRRAHQLAKLHREEYDTYRQALSYGLTTAWKEARVVQADVNEEFAQSCMGNIVEVDVCESTHAA